MTTTAPARTTARSKPRTVASATTAEQKRAQAEQLHDTITAQVEQLRDSGRWEAFLNFAQGFHQYSINNLLLILSQCPEAENVAGFRQWQARGRQVRKGEKAIRIFGFATKKLEDDTPEGAPATTDSSGQKVRKYFPMLSVFDLSQTDSIDPDNDVTQMTQQLTGEDPLGILDAVTDHLTGKGWTLTRKPIPGATNGITHTDGSRVVIVDSNLSPAMAAKTAIHEAAHVLLHADEDHAEYIEHRGEKETEAESVAYIVAGILGLDTSAYSIGYVAGWSDADPQVLKSTATRVLKAAHSLATALTGTE